MGIPVLLSGAGGDDLFSGYRRHRALHFERLWSRLPAGRAPPAASGQCRGFSGSGTVEAPGAPRREDVCVCRRGTIAALPRISGGAPSA